MADQYQEGDLAEDAAGHRMQLKNGQWVPAVSVGEDMAKSTGPALEREAVGVGTALPTMAGMLYRGVNAAGDYAFPDWKQSGVGQFVQGLQKINEPGTYNDTQQRIEKSVGHPFYSAETTPGKLWEAGVQSLPFAAPEMGAAPSMVRALLAGGRAGLSGAASEGAGEATQGTPYEIPARMAAGALTYGATGAGVPASTVATTPRAAMAQTLEGAGVPVSAADTTGSRLMATLEGRPPAGQADALSSTVQRMGGMPQTPGDIRTFSERVAARRAQLQNAVQGLEANTSFTPTPQLGQQMQQTAWQALQGAKSPAESSDIVNGLNEYNARAGMGDITGQQYNDLRQRWNSSGVPALREMATHLDNAMDTAAPGAWPAWRQAWGDYEGLQSVSDSMGGAATTSPLNVAPIVKSMYAKTPMRDVAEASQGILGQRPPPYALNANSAAHVTGATLGTLGGLYGASTGDLHSVADPLIAGTVFGEVLPRAMAAGSTPIQGFFRSRPGQNLMLNMDPQTAALLLANQGIVSKQSAAPPPPDQASQ